MIKEYIQKHFEKKLESANGLVIYDPTKLYHEIVRNLENDYIKVFVEKKKWVKKHVYNKIESSWDILK